MVGALLTGLRKKQLLSIEFFHLLLPASVALLLVGSFPSSQILILLLFPYLEPVFTKKC